MNQLSRVIHLFVSELGYHWFKLWLSACSAPSHHFNQCRCLVKCAFGNKYVWSLIQDTISFIQENKSENGKITTILSQSICFNSLKPNDEFVRQWNRPSLVKIKACRMLCAKPLPEPMLVYCKVEPQEQTSMKSKSTFKHFHSRKWVWKCRLPKCPPSCLSLTVLIRQIYGSSEKSTCLGYSFIRPEIHEPSRAHVLYTKPFAVTTGYQRYRLTINVVFEDHVLIQVCADYLGITQREVSSDLSTPTLLNSVDNACKGGEQFSQIQDLQPSFLIRILRWFNVL